MTLRSRLTQLEKKAAPPDAVKPILIMKCENEVYHSEGRDYTADEVDELKEHYQLIIICYSDEWPPGDMKIREHADALDILEARPNEQNQ